MRYKVGLSQPQDLVVEQVVRELVRYKQGQLFFTHGCQLEDGDGQEEPLVQIHKHNERVVVNECHLGAAASLGRVKEMPFKLIGCDNVIQYFFYQLDLFRVLLVDVILLIYHDFLADGATD